MTNLTEEGNHTTVLQLVCTNGLYGAHLKIFISSINIPLSITAFLGNVLIIVALQKVLSLHPPSKLLYRCLVSTDLCVGLITQPLFVTFLMSPEHSKLCYYLKILFNAITTIFCGVSLFTLTAISVDRLLALLLGLRYRQVVTLRRVRVFVSVAWIYNTAISLMIVYNYRTTMAIICVVLLLCVVTSTFCYMTVYIKLRHQNPEIHQGQPNRGGIPLNIARYRKTVSIAFWIQLTLLACYLPLGIVSAVKAITGISTPAISFASSVATSLLYLNSSLNPFLYCLKMREVKRAVKDTIKQFRCFSS